ncbi:MAG TPA: hypothetical protein VGP89_12925 [Candidatus Angelobacter sp.]|jgi:hypothetical protein|nr:hypothetical protein [Candidatus Angelobacter sp.]
MGFSLVKTVQGWASSVRSALGKRVAEAVTPFLFGLTAADGEDAKFRRITSPNTIRDLNPLMHERMQAVCFYLKSTTPFGKRIVEVISDYVVGEGFTPSSEDQQVMEVIKRFWEDPVNRMAHQKMGQSNLREFCDELTTFGELCLPVAVNPVDGFVRLGYVDPIQIESVEYGQIETASGQQQITLPVSVLLKRKQSETVGQRLDIIRIDEDINSPTFGQLKGDCFYFAINKAKGASRGLSELFALADWIDVFDQMMFDFADRVRFLNAFVWHYTIKGASEPDLEKWNKKVTQNPPRQGSVWTTNENVTIDAKTPSFAGADMSKGLQQIKMYGLGGIGLPAWFFADPMDSNRNTADEMTGPTGKKLTERQNQIRGVVQQVLMFAIQQAIYHGVLPENVDTTISLQVPDLMIKDLVKASQTLGAVVNSASIMAENGYITDKTAARTCHIVLSQIGIEVDADEFEKAQAEKKARTDALVPEQTVLSKALAQLEKTQASAAGGVQ